jgi:hypothetical protein
MSSLPRLSTTKRPISTAIVIGMALRTRHCGYRPGLGRSARSNAIDRAERADGVAVAAFSHLQQHQRAIRGGASLGRRAPTRYQSRRYSGAGVGKALRRISFVIARRSGLGGGQRFCQCSGISTGRYSEVAVPANRRAPPFFSPGSKGKGDAPFPHSAQTALLPTRGPGESRGLFHFLHCSLIAPDSDS